LIQFYFFVTKLINSFILDIVSLSISFQNSFLKATSKSISSNTLISFQCLYANSSISAFLNISDISESFNQIAFAIFKYNESLHAIFQFKALLTEGLEAQTLSAISVIVIDLSSIRFFSLFQIKELLIKLGFILYIIILFFINL